MRISDWIGLCCGDKVCRYDDPRHIGRVEAVHTSVKVRWYDNRILSYEDHHDLIIVEKVKDKVVRGAQRPRTVVESPRAKLERLFAGR